MASSNSRLSLSKRREQLEEDLKAIEKQIFDTEESYIEETNHGNVIKGWDSFLNSKPKSSHSARKTKIAEKDRIFSNSSTSAPRDVPEEQAQQPMQVDGDGNELYSSDEFAHE